MISIVQGYDFTRGGKRPMVKIGNTTFFDWRRIPGHYLCRLRGMINRHFAEQGAALGGCSNCGSFHRLDWQPSMTAYASKPGEPDPNAPVWLCEDCAADYEDHWTAMWDEYHRSHGW
jgi:hypothetical protein